MPAGASAVAGTPDLFISYARDDGTFVHELDAALEGRGKLVWVDWEDIRPSADWRSKIEAGIEAAKTFVAVLSPELISSPVCREELAHAVASNKRIIPILRREIGRAAAPPELTAPNWLFFRNGDDFQGALEQLVETLETDLDWLDEHARLLVQATEWKRENGDASFLLRGSELRAAEEWLARQGEHKEAATPLQSEYILASRRAAARTQRIVFGAVLVALIVALAVAAFAFLQRNEANAEKRLAIARERTGLLASAATAQSDTHVDVSLLLALEAVRAGPDRESPSIQAEDSMISALETVRTTGAEAILHGDSDILWSVSFSPDGRTLASASENGTVRLWDVRKRRRLGALQELSRPVPSGALAPTHIYSVAFSPDGQMLATGGEDGTVQLWDVRARRRLAQLQTAGSSVYSVAFSPDGTMLAAAGGDAMVRLWGVENRTLLREWPAAGNWVHSVGFSSDGSMLATAGGDGVVRLWAPREGRKLGELRGQGGAVFSVAFSPDGRTLATGSEDKKVRLWDIRTRRLLEPPLVGHTDVVWSVAFSPGGRMLASASPDGAAQLWDVRMHKSRAVLPGFAGHLQSVAFSGDGHTVAAAAWNGEVLLWDVREQQLAGGAVYHHAGHVTSVVVSPDGYTLASASDDGTIRLWDVRARRQLTQLRATRGGGVASVAFSPDGRELVSGGAEATVRLWDVRTRHGKALYRQTAPVTSVALSRDGRTLASAGKDGTVVLWDVAKGRKLGELRGRTGAVLSVAFSPDGRTLAAGAADRTVRLWDIRTQRLLESPLRGHTDAVLSVAFSLDGRTLASGSGDGTARLWDVRRHRESALLRRHGGAVEGLAFSPDGHLLASAGDDGTVRLWDVRAHVQLGQPLTGESGVASVAFSPDRRTLASGGDDGAVRLWRLALWQNFSDLQRQVCSLVVGDLTKDEWKELAPGVPYQAPCAN